MIFLKRKKREFCIINRKEVYNGALDLATTSRWNRKTVVLQEQNKQNVDQKFWIFFGYVGFGCSSIVGWFLSQSYRLGVRSWGLEFSGILNGFHKRKKKKKKKKEKKKKEEEEEEEEEEKDTIG